MGLELVLLPLGISPWNTGSGTSCSHCHENMRPWMISVPFTCLSGSRCNRGEAVARRKYFCRKLDVIEEHKRTHPCLVQIALCSLSVAQIILRWWITETERRLWHFLHDVTSSPPVDLFGSPSLLCCHRNPRRGMRAPKMKLGLVVGGNTGHVSALSSHWLCQTLLEATIMRFCWSSSGPSEHTPTKHAWIMTGGESRMIWSDSTKYDSGESGLQPALADVTKEVRKPDCSVSTNKNRVKYLKNIGREWHCSSKKKSTVSYRVFLTSTSPCHSVVCSVCAADILRSKKKKKDLATLIPLLISLGSHWLCFESSHHH